MKTLLALFALTFTTLALADPAADPRAAAIIAVDTARVQATLHPDREVLEAVISDELRYAHSSGDVDSKTTYLGKLASGSLKYVGYEYEDRQFTFPSADIALMSGRAQVKVANATGEVAMTLSYLAVWRNESGHWRFLAWQSGKLPPAAKP